MRREEKGAGEEGRDRGKGGEGRKKGGDTYLANFTLLLSSFPSPPPSPSPSQMSQVQLDGQ